MTFIFITVLYIVYLNNVPAPFYRVKIPIQQIPKGYARNFLLIVLQCLKRPTIFWVLSKHPKNNPDAITFCNICTVWHGKEIKSLFLSETSAPSLLCLSSLVQSSSGNVKSNIIYNTTRNTSNLNIKGLASGKFGFSLFSVWHFFPAPLHVLPFHVGSMHFYSKSDLVTEILTAFLNIFINIVVTVLWDWKLLLIPVFPPKSSRRFHFFNETIGKHSSEHHQKLSGSGSGVCRETELKKISPLRGRLY